MRSREQIQDGGEWPARSCLPCFENLTAGIWIKHLSERTLPSQKCRGRTQSCTCCAGVKNDQRGAREPCHEQLIPDTRNVVLLCLLKFSLQNLAFSHPQLALGCFPLFLTSHYLFYATYSTTAGEH